MKGLELSLLLEILNQHLTSELYIELYTDGSNGNFELYLGDDIQVYRNSTKYESNSKVPIIAITVSIHCR